MTAIDALLPVRTIRVDRDDPKALAAAIGSEWIEIVRTRIREVILVVDEDGLATTKGVNRRVAGLYPGVIVGDVLLCAQELGDDGYDLASITPAHIHRALLDRDGQEAS